MSTKKSSRSDAPQISISSWILGGPIVVRPRRHPLPPVLVTTEPVKTVKKIEEVKTTEVSTGNGNKAGPEPKAPSMDTEMATRDNHNNGAMSNSNNNNNNNNNNNWTAEQDTLILQLKAANSSWKDIASQMSLPKSTIQARYKELRKNPNATTAPQATAPGTENNDNNDDTTFLGGLWNHDDGAQVAGGLNSDGTRLKADDSWTREDCEMLEMLEMRYREEKWLSIQASFYNMTGRMIAADIIKVKLAEGSR